MGCWEWLIVGLVLLFLVGVGGAIYDLVDSLLGGPAKRMEHKQQSVDERLTEIERALDQINERLSERDEKR